MPLHHLTDPESKRLDEDERRVYDWKRWGPYLSERQWGTVREDYSADGTCWSYLPHDHARSRAYRWGEDGLLGLTDRQCRLCFSLALWNERDPILKERLFGLSGPEGNHGEDVKELYYYLDSTPTHSWMRALYKYPHGEFPYGQLVAENARRGRGAPEYELLDTGIFDENRYFDVEVCYAKAGPDDVLIAIDVTNRGPAPARLHVLPTLWARNTWSWGREGEGYWPKPNLEVAGGHSLRASHASLGTFWLQSESIPGERHWMVTENETNHERLFGAKSESRYVKDAFHRSLVNGESGVLNPGLRGTKAALRQLLDLAPGETQTLRLRLTGGDDPIVAPFGREFQQVFERRRHEADVFYAQRSPASLSADERLVSRQAYAGLLWSKQYYGYAVHQWLAGDPKQPQPPNSRRTGRNSDWEHVYARDILSMPDKWEYPWFAAWDLAFQMLPMVKVDPQFAKSQLLLLMREWYMHPSGQLPAYEFAFGDVNPPVHAWAGFRVYKMAAGRGARDRAFLERVFHKLLLNFTWWVNRKDPGGHNLFGGGFLGLDNIGLFDRSQPLPGAHLEQSDGTAWMAFFCSYMLEIALELAQENPAYEDMASKFFEHYVAISDAANRQFGTGLWDAEDGFYYDWLTRDGERSPLRLRSVVGVIPVLAVGVLEQSAIDRLPGFAKRLRWFLDNRPDLAQSLPFRQCPPTDTPGESDGGGARRLLSIASKEKLIRICRRLFSEEEFLSPYGLRSLSKVYADAPYVHDDRGKRTVVQYLPGESTVPIFGGNSNWRGPVWFPINYLLIEALERYHHFYGETLTVEYPTGSGQHLTLAAVAKDLSARLSCLMLRGDSGHRPSHGGEARYATDPHFRDLLLFYEYFHGDDGHGLGASHQTGWTALVARLIERGV